MFSEIGDLVVATLRCNMREQTHPGQCIKVNDKWLAIADHTGAWVKVLVSKDSFLLRDPIRKFEGPVGPGFRNAMAESAIIIAGGTGLGAVSRLVRQRAIEGVETRLVFFGKNVRKGQVVDFFPAISQCKELIIWDTAKNGRPASPLAPIAYVPEGSRIFVAGPKSLVEATRAAAADRGLEVELNF